MGVGDGLEGFAGVSRGDAHGSLERPFREASSTPHSGVFKPAPGFLVGAVQRPIQRIFEVGFKAISARFRGRLEAVPGLFGALVRLFGCLGGVLEASESVSEAS